MIVHYDAQRCWPEDYGHENGNYENFCVYCNQRFLGHKRRVVCKLCAWANASINSDANEVIPDDR